MLLSQMIFQEKLGILLEAEIASISEIKRVKNDGEKSDEVEGESLEVR